MSVVVRSASVRDARAIAEVQVAGWQAAYRGLMPDAILDRVTLEVREPAWERNLSEVHADQRTMVIEREGGVFGFASFGPSRYEPGLGEVWALYVAPSAWRTGAGRLLMDEGLRFFAERELAGTMLWVLEGNARAIRFYEACGFHLDGGRLERDGLHHLRMRR